MLPLILFKVLRDYQDKKKIKEIKEKAKVKTDISMNGLQLCVLTSRYVPQAQIELQMKANGKRKKKKK